MRIALRFRVPLIFLEGESSLGMAVWTGPHNTLSFASIPWHNW